MQNATLSHRQFITAGKATFTVASKATGKHFTYKVARPSENAPWFVSVLTGTDNEGDFSFLGTIFPDGNFRHGKKSRITPDAPSAKGFEWLWRNVDAIPTEKAEFLPACTCCRCGRKLTNPESVENAVGPECRKMMGL